jgi:hypothetical protein
LPKLVNCTFNSRKLKILSFQAERAKANEELERIRLADEALALELSGREDNIRKLRRSTIIQTPPSSRKRPRKTSSDAKSTPAAKKINKFFSSK